MMDAIVEQIVSVGWGVLVAIVPLAMLFLLFQIFLLKLPLRQVADILTGTVIAAVGLFLFLVGIEVGFLPFGKLTGQALGSLDQTWLIVILGAVLGFATTWGEPAVRVLADQVEDASNGSIRRDLVLYAICIGVAFWVGMGMLRIIYSIPLQYLLVPGYAVIIILMRWCDRGFLGIAVDAGGVATGPLANTFLLALALGTSASVGQGNPVVDGFGFVALIAVAPIIPVIVLGFLIHRVSSERE